MLNKIIKKTKHLLRNYWKRNNRLSSPIFYKKSPGKLPGLFCVMRCHSRLLDFMMHVEGALLAIGQFAADFEMVHTLLIEGDVGTKLAVHAHHHDRLAHLAIRRLNLDCNFALGQINALRIHKTNHNVVGHFHAVLGHLFFDSGKKGEWASLGVRKNVKKW